MTEAEKQTAPAAPVNPIASLIINTKNLNPRAPKIVIAGLNKVGKTTWAAEAPKPIFVPFEDGLSNIKGVEAFPIVRSFAEFHNYLEFLANEKHNFKTVVIDSADWASQVVDAHVCSLNNWASVETPGFGKGFTQSALEWRNILATLDRINAKGIAVIIISHVRVKTLVSPLWESFDAYQLKTHEKTASLICEWADVIGFASTKIATLSQNTGFGNQQTRAVATGERFFYVESSPAYPSGTRYSFLKDMPLDGALFWKAFNEGIKNKGEK